MKKDELNPKLILAVSLLHMANANGEIANEQMMYLLTVLHGDNKLISQANKYIKKSIQIGRTLQDFLDEAKDLICDEQKEFIVINMIDIMLSDSNCDVHEERLLGFYLDSFNFDEEKYLNYKSMIYKKNNYDLFDL